MTEIKRTEGESGQKRDVVERLRKTGPEWTRVRNNGSIIPYEACADGANEIERLRAALSDPSCPGNINRLRLEELDAAREEAKEWKGAWELERADRQHDWEIGARMLEAGEEMEKAAWDFDCPRPANSAPDELTIRQCIDRGECGCDFGIALAKFTHAKASGGAG